MNLNSNYSVNTPISRIIEDLEKLEDAIKNQNLQIDIKSDAVNEFYSGVLLGKPEEQTKKLFLSIITPIIREYNLNLVPEYRIDTNAGKKFIDFAIVDEFFGVTAIEIKPFCIATGSTLKLTDIHTLFNKSRKELKDYLTYTKRLKFLIFTNLRDIYVFTKSNYIEEDLNPSYRDSFYVFIKNFLKQPRGTRIKDYLIRCTAGYIPRDLDKKFLAELKGYWDKLNFLKNEDRAKLINILIMLRILEDNHAIGYGWTEEMWSQSKLFHGENLVNHLKHFFGSFVRNVIYEYYDTELLDFDLSKFLERYTDKKDLDSRLYFSLEEILGFSLHSKLALRGLKYYDFSQINEDIFGKVYEKFLADLRDERGIYYTRAFVTEYISKQVVKKLFGPVIENANKLLVTDDLEEIKNLREKIINQLNRIKILDPACGSGSFLIKVLREIYKSFYKPFVDNLKQKIKYLQANGRGDRLFIEDQNLTNHIKELQELLREIAGETDYDLMKNICIRHIFGVDIDPKAVEIARLNIWKELVKLEGDLYQIEKVRRFGNHCVFPNLSNNIKCFDSLSEDFHKHFPYKFLGIVGNPPYGDLFSKLLSQKKISYEKIIEYEEKYPNSYIREISSLFVEKAVNLLEEGGILGFIITFAITFNKELSKTRELLSKNFEEVKIWSFDRDKCRMFEDEMTQSVSILIAMNKRSDCQHNGTKFFTSQFYRSFDEENFEKFMNNSPLSAADFFLLPKHSSFSEKHRLPKIGSEINKNILEKLYKRKDVLANIIDKEPCKKLYYRTSGNYWYNAWDYKPYDSTEIKEIRVQEEWASIFLLIVNSSLFYFWMRIYGDGRHLNSDILKEFPLPCQDKINEIKRKFNIYPEKLSTLLMNSLRKVFCKNQFETSKIKHIIDKIDVYLGIIYELTPEEISHILDYDKEVRGGCKIERKNLETIQNIENVIFCELGSL